MDYIILDCPHCKEPVVVYIKELNCHIFRHGIYKKTLKQIDPHMKKEKCDYKITLYTNNFGHIIKMRVSSPAQIQWVEKEDLLGNGKTLHSKLGISIIILKSYNMDEKFGGDVTLNYLVEYNILSPSKRKNLNMQLLRKSGKWLLKYRNRKVDRLEVIPYSKGIQELKVITSSLNDLDINNL